MTELEMFLAACKREKITVEETVKKDKTTIITIEKGYVGFFVDIEFRSDGTMKNIGAWE
jgi:hypothetical protein